MAPREPTASAEPLAGALARAGLAPPRALTLALTGRCNLACLHCLVEAGPRAGAAHVPAEVLLRVIAELPALGVRTLRLTGGEPLLHPRWDELVARCGRAPWLDALVLQTNAAALDEADARALRRLGGPRLAIEVSLDGATPATHDAVRGPGAFERTLRGLERLCAAGLAPATTVAFTEMHHNLDDLPALLELVRRLGLHGLVAGTLVASGRASRSPLAAPEPDDYRRLLARYERSPRFRALCDRHAALPALAWWRGRHGDGGECCVPGAAPYLGADGLLRPCALCRGDDVALPGAHARPLADVLAGAGPRWSALAETKRRRRALAACSGCPGQRHCGGGCLGRAQAAGAGVDAVEDRCALRRAVYLWGREPPRAPPASPEER